MALVFGMPSFSLPSRVAVFGCDGFIGSRLVGTLLARGGVEVVGWDRERRRVTEFVGHPRFRFREADLALDWESVRKDVAGSDVVVNLAALCNPSLYGTRTLDVIASNFTHVEPVVRFCAEAKVRLVHFSTCEVFGRRLRSWLPESVTAELPEELEIFDEERTPFLLGPLDSTRWSYACAKQLAERLIEAWGREAGLDWSIVRPFNFIGPGMDFLPGYDGEGVPRVMACFVKALIDREPLKLVDGGLARRTFLHVDEAVDGVVRILERPEAASRKVFHFGNPGNETTIRDLAGSMRSIWAELRQDPSILDLPLEPVPSEEFYGAGYDDSDRRIPCIKNAHSLLGWEPRLSLGETLGRTLLDYHQRFPEASR